MLHWSSMINFINVCTDDTTLLDTYSLQYKSFKWRILNQKKNDCYMNKRKKLVVILFVQSTSFIFLYNYDTTLLLNFTSSAYFSLTKDMKYFQPMLYWSMMINFVNAFLMIILFKTRTLHSVKVSNGGPCTKSYLPPQ